MGLDIYLRKGKRNLSDKDNISATYDEFSNAKIEEYFSQLRKWQPKRFKTENAAIKKLYKLMMKYDASAYRYAEWNNEKNCWKCNITTIEQAKEYVAKTLSMSVEDFFSESDLYYRKVNFLYAFFPPVEHEMAWIEKSDAQSLVDRCDEVLALDKDNLQEADDILPTQSGFFFGSTDYDKWYISDVKQVRREFKKYLKNWAEDEVAIIAYSW